MPLRRVCVVIRPGVESYFLENVCCIVKPVRRIFIGNVSNWIVTGRIVIAILKEVDIMSELSKSEHVLQMMPRDSAQRTADYITQNDDPQLAVFGKLWNCVTDFGRIH